MLKFMVQPGGKLQGCISIPGDKSISHRAIMLGSLAQGVSHFDNFLAGHDCIATINAFRQLGVSIDGPHDNHVDVHGVGMHGLQAPTKPLDLGNSGTSIRLLSGILAGQKFSTTLTGDASLRKRPMERIATPLRQMGASIETTSGKPPITINASKQLQGISYALPVASAQLKSCLLLAGLYAKEKTEVSEPGPTRDHTERMLQTMAYPVQSEAGVISLEGGGQLKPMSMTIPGDISSAAFFMVAASIAEQADLTLKQVGINPTRIGVINILRLMGANISLTNEHYLGSEPVADINVTSAPLRGIRIPKEQVPLAIDEFPALFIAASVAEGETILEGAAELRVKESDRIQTMVDGLQQLGISAKELPDGAVINGGIIRGGEVDSHGDHRVAMAFSLAGLRAQQAITINDCDNVATSFPQFVALAQGIGLGIDVL